MNLHYEGIFTIPVIQRKIEEMEDYNENIIKNLDSFMEENQNFKPINWSCDLYVSGIHKNILRNKLFKKLKYPILKHSNEFCEIMGYDNIKYKPVIKECWINVYGVNQNQEIHNHIKRHISGVYYPTSSIDDGILLFISPLFGTNYEDVPIKKINNTNSGSYIVTTEKSKMVLFPSYLLHSVTPNKSKRRICIAFNLDLEKK